MGGSVAFTAAAAIAAAAHQGNGTPTTARPAKPGPTPKQHCSSCGAPIDMTRTDCGYCRTPLFRTPPNTWAQLRKD